MELELKESGRNWSRTFFVRHIFQNSKSFQNMLFSLAAYTFELLLLYMNTYVKSRVKWEGYVGEGDVKL